jgi:hypothetical protein
MGLSYFGTMVTSETRLAILFSALCRRRGLAAAPVVKPTAGDDPGLAQILPRVKKTQVRKSKVGEISGAADGEICYQKC